MHHNRPFDCGIHHCKKPCHVPSLTPAPCPRSPKIVTRCPCGKHELTAKSAPFFPPGTLLTRTECTDPVPTCASTCMKVLEGCTHVCSAPCHTGPCPPCSIRLVRPCRCGSTTREVLCSADQASARARARGEAGSDTEILCERPCNALRACGRHQCNRPCCPLASLASLAKGKGKKKALDVLEDPEGWNECDLVCGKLLNCGNHNCEERDHKGVCPPCLRSSFEEVCCRSRWYPASKRLAYASIRWSATAGAPSSSPRFPVVRGCRAATLVLGRHPSAAIQRRHTRVTKTRLDARHART